MNKKPFNNKLYRSQADQDEWEKLFTYFTKDELKKISKMKGKEFWNYVETHKKPAIKEWISTRLNRIIHEAHCNYISKEMAKLNPILERTKYQKLLQELRELRWNNESKTHTEEFCDKCGRELHPAEIYDFGYCSYCEPEKFETWSKGDSK